MIVENVKRLCQERNTSIYALERATGIGNGVIARWDRNSPKVSNLIKVAKHFGVTVDELLRNDVTESRGD